MEVVSLLSDVIGASHQLISCIYLVVQLQLHMFNLLLPDVCHFLRLSFSGVDLLLVSFLLFLKEL